MSRSFVAFRRFVGVGALAALALPSTALADGPDADAPVAAGFPITAPDYDPTVIGVGHDDDAIAAYNTPTILFTNFGGAKLNSGCGNDSHNDCSTLGGLFGGEILPYSGSEAEIATIVQNVREDVLDFGVVVVGERPPSNQPYAMVMVGNGVSGGQDFGGIAPTIDCGNSNPNITSFALELGGSNIMATVIHQEAAHTWGLEHVNDPTDNLHPSAGGFTDPKYNDVCNKIVADTDLNPSNGQCNTVHTQFCNQGNQNSYQEMLLLFGPTIADTTAPTVIIESPGEGEVLDCPVDFDLIITLDDDRRPATLKTDVLLDGVEVIGGGFVNSTLKFPVAGGIPSGPHTFRVDIEDESGNPASAEVNFAVADNPGNPECAMVSTTTSESGTDGDPTTDTATATATVTATATAGGGDGGDDGCACSTRSSRAPWASLLWLPVLVARRRRR